MRAMPVLPPMLDTLSEDSELRLDDLLLTPTTAFALLTSTATDAACPACGTRSRRFHSGHCRTVANLPCHNRALVLRLVVRRFRCVHPECPQSIFCERPPACSTPTLARRTA